MKPLKLKRNRMTEMLHDKIRGGVVGFAAGAAYGCLREGKGIATPDEEYICEIPENYTSDFLEEYLHRFEVCLGATKRRENTVQSRILIPFYPALRQAFGVDRNTVEEEFVEFLMATVVAGDVWNRFKTAEDRVIVPYDTPKDFKADDIDSRDLWSYAKRMVAARYMKKSMYMYDPESILALGSIIGGRHSPVLAGVTGMLVGTVYGFDELVAGLTDVKKIARWGDLCDLSDRWVTAVLGRRRVCATCGGVFYTADDIDYCCDDCKDKTSLTEAQEEIRKASVRQR